MQARLSALLLIPVATTLIITTFILFTFFSAVIPTYLFFPLILGLGTLGGVSMLIPMLYLIFIKIQRTRQIYRTKLHTIRNAMRMGHIVYKIGFCSDTNYKKLSQTIHKRTLAILSSRYHPQFFKIRINSAIRNQIAEKLRNTSNITAEQINRVFPIGCLIDMRPRFKVYKDCLSQTIDEYGMDTIIYDQIHHRVKKIVNQEDIDYIANQVIPPDERDYGERVIQTAHRIGLKKSRKRIGIALALAILLTGGAVWGGFVAGILTHLPIFFMISVGTFLLLEGVRFFYILVGGQANNWRSRISYILGYLLTNTGFFLLGLHLTGLWILPSTQWLLAIKIWVTLSVLSACLAICLGVIQLASTPDEPLDKKTGFATWMQLTGGAESFVFMLIFLIGRGITVINRYIATFFTSSIPTTGTPEPESENERQDTQPTLQLNDTTQPIFIAAYQVMEENIVIQEGWIQMDIHQTLSEDLVEDKLLGNIINEAIDDAVDDKLLGNIINEAIDEAVEDKVLDNITNDGVKR